MRMMYYTMSMYTEQLFVSWQVPGKDRHITRGRWKTRACASRQAHQPSSEKASLMATAGLGMEPASPTNSAWSGGGGGGRGCLDVFSCSYFQLALNSMHTTRALYVWQPDNVERRAGGGCRLGRRGNSHEAIWPYAGIKSLFANFVTWKFPVQWCGRTERWF